MTKECEFKKSGKLNMNKQTYYDMDRIQFSDILKGCINIILLYLWDNPDEKLLSQGFSHG